MRMIYTCPYAHYVGHYPQAVTKEASLLAKAGIEVHLLTFDGILNGEEPQVVAHHRVLSRNKMLRPLTCLLRLAREWLVTKWLLMFVEAFLTLLKALWLKRKLNCHIIHLRDGEPFLFIPHLLGLFFTDLSWSVCLVSNPNSYLVRSKNSTGIAWDLGFNALDKFINARLWRPIYRASLSRNRFVFLTLNEQTKDAYENYQRGVFRGKVICVPIGSEKPIGEILKKEARRHLGLPENRLQLLSFGTIHSGKDLKVLLETIKDLSDIIFVQAGKILPRQIPHLNSSREAQSGKVIIRNYYIPESEKKYYFFAADAVVLSYIKNFTQSASLLWEACRFRTPVIASDCGELGNLVRAFNVGLLFEPQEASSLREAITHFLNLTAGQKREMKGNCERFNSAYSAEKWVQRIVKIYRDLVGSTSIETTR